MSSPPPLELTIGALFIGLVVGSVLYGVTLLQTYLYYRNYPGDSRIMKGMVAALVSLDTLHMMFCIITIYWYLVTNYNHPQTLAELHWSMDLQVDCNGLIGLMVECFFARRVWLMSKNKYLVAVITLLSVLHFALGIVFTASAFALKEFAALPKLLWATVTGLGAAALCDILIAGSLCWYLSKSRTGFHRTDSLITTLMVYSMNTGLLTSIIAFLCVILFCTMMDNLVWIALFWVLGKCYVNSFLATLNSRDHLREKVTGVVNENSFLHLTPVHPTSITCVQDSQGGALSPTQKLQKDLTVVVQTTTTSKSDYVDSPGNRSQRTYSSSEGRASPVVTRNRIIFPPPASPA